MPGVPSPSLSDVRCRLLALEAEVLVLPAARVAHLADPTRSWVCAGTLPLRAGDGLPTFDPDAAGFLRPLTRDDTGLDLPDGLAHWHVLGATADGGILAVHDPLGSVAAFPDPAAPRIGPDLVPEPVSTGVPALAACLLAAVETPALSRRLFARIREVEPDGRCRDWWARALGALPAGAPDRGDLGDLPHQAGASPRAERLERARRLVEADRRVEAAVLLYDVLEEDEGCVEAYRLLVDLHLRSGERARASAVADAAALTVEAETLAALRAAIDG